MRMEWDRIGRNKGCFRDARDGGRETKGKGKRGKENPRTQKGKVGRGGEHLPWLLFLDRFLRNSLRSVANPNSKSFSLIFGFGRFIVSPLKIKSTGSACTKHNKGIDSPVKERERERERARKEGNEEITFSNLRKSLEPNCWKQDETSSLPKL